MKKEALHFAEFYPCWDFVHPTFDNYIIAATVVMRTSAKQHIKKMQRVYLNDIKSNAVGGDTAVAAPQTFCLPQKYEAMFYNTFQ